MEIRIKHVKKTGLAFMGSVLWLAASASAQSTPAQSTPVKSDSRSMGDNDRDDATRQELSRFDQFLDGHREIAEQLKKDPSLANNSQFLKSHPALQSYLQEHPGISSQLRNDPNEFIRQETQYDRREDSWEARRRELARFDQFLDAHKETASQLRKDPSLVDNAQFLTEHPELRDYLQNHPQTKEAIQRDPNGFMRQETQYDRREDQSMSRDYNRDRERDRDVDRNDGRRQEEMARFDQFLDSHREVAEQLRKNPQLANDPTFLKNHPGLETYLQQHPMVKDDLGRNPNALLREEARYEQREPSDLTPGPSRDRDTARYDGRYNGDKDTAGNQGRKDYDDRDRDRGAMHDRSASFGSFLGTHTSIAQQLANNPSLAKDKAYLASHPELQSYLSSHPEVREELMENPQGFVKAAQQYNKGTTTNSATSPPPTTATAQSKH